MARDQDEMNKLAAEGWALVTASAGYSAPPMVVAIFRRPVYSAGSHSRALALLKAQKAVCVKIRSYAVVHEDGARLGHLLRRDEGEGE